MRISDWSSDVCSSDLVAPPSVNRFRLRNEMACHVDKLACRPELRHLSGLSWRMADAPLQALVVPYIMLQWRHVEVADHHSLARCKEIGRGSCRVRVCQYV